MNRSVLKNLMQGYAVGLFILGLFVFLLALYHTCTGNKDDFGVFLLLLLYLQVTGIIGCLTD